MIIDGEIPEILLLSLYNEGENILPLYNKLVEVMERVQDSL